ncbi:MAG TPA: hypothetical protein VN729_05920, partial [Ktedonobacteraceae bacterium]|nr:hypothetical protein [Ktedonobacteraceae bacterium]
MAHADVYPTQGTPPDVPIPTDSHRSERRLRRVSIWLMLVLLFQGGLGAVWDREWHAYVGRDQFWTPPHTMIYSCVAGVGLMVLALVLVETFRYRRGTEGVNDTSTVRVLGFFHAPLGFIIAGFGALLALIAAPLDNYWHELYGIDVALWAPFHLMGITGGMIGIFGLVYVFAGEAAIDRQKGRLSRRWLGLTALEWGALLVLASMMNFTLTGFLQFPIASFGPLSVSTYPLPLVLSGTFSFIGAQRLTRRPGVSLIIVVLLLINTLAVELFIPWAIRTGVEWQGLAYRTNQEPYFSWSYALLPLVFLIPALVVDGLALWSQRRQRQFGKTMRGLSLIGLIITPPIVVLVPFVLQSYSSFAPIFLPQAGLPVAPA